MNIIDAHVHLYPEPCLEKECSISQEPVNKLLTCLSLNLKQRGVQEALVYALDEKVIMMDLKVPENLFISSVVGIDTFREDIKMASAKGIRIIKIMPYVKKITRDMYPRMTEIAMLAKDSGMILTVCSSYGTGLLYDTNGIELAAFIKRRVEIPIILAHGGGPRILDAMSIALDYQNIFLDISFALRYWWGSSVIKDYAFALNKMGYERCFYGSDYPYVDMNESLEYFMRFVHEFGIKEEDRDKILYLNFEKFKDLYLKTNKNA